MEKVPRVLEGVYGAYIIFLYYIYVLNVIENQTSDVIWRMRVFWNPLCKNSRKWRKTPIMEFFPEKEIFGILNFQNREYSGNLKFRNPPILEKNFQNSQFRKF